MDSVKSVSLFIIVVMFADYISAVVLDYQKKKKANTLPFSSIQPSPAELKAACLVACRKRFEKRDGRALEAFFREGENMETCLKAINDCDIDKFRPLIKFLNGETKTTRDKNIELLAWLIDFEPRPFVFGRNYDTNSLAAPKHKKDETQKDGVEQPLLTDDPEGSDQPSQPDTPKDPNQLGQLAAQPASGSKTKKNIVLVTITLAFGAVGIFWARTINRSTIIFTGPQACMFWVGDHYQQTPCNQKLGDTLVIALDSEKLIHFKKITQPDTITGKSKGMVWYVKYNGNLEYYTSGGFHPIDQRLRLKPITDFMIRKHIHPGQEAEQASK